MGFLDDIENLAKSNPSQTDGIIGEAEKLAEQQSGGQFNSEITAGGQQVENFLGTEQGGNQQPQGN